jgi:hypothetical protein
VLDLFFCFILFKHCIIFVDVFVDAEFIFVMYHHLIPKMPSRDVALYSTVLYKKKLRSQAFFSRRFTQVARACALELIIAYYSLALTYSHY